MLGKIVQITLLITLLVFQGCTRLPVIEHGVTETIKPITHFNKPSEKISVTVGPSGGMVANEFGDTWINVPAGTVVTDTQFNMIRKRDHHGTYVTTIQTDLETGPLQIFLPEAEFLSHVLPSASQLERLQGQVTPVDTSENSTYPLKYIWDSRKAHFWKTHSGIGIGNRVSGLINYRSTQAPYFLTTVQTAVELSSNCDSVDIACYRGKEPILLVHGYTPTMTGLGGGESTWKQLPARLLDLDSKYVVFELRWVTAARFEEVAADLGRAIELVAKNTGKTVHLLGHSFGGLLIRTYLQGFAVDFPYRGHVASVTTVGTPHSGLTDEDKLLYNRFFKRGQDTQGLIDGKIQIHFCQQVSCYQAGHFVDFTDDEQKVFKLNFADESFDNSRPLQDIPDNLDLKQRPGKLMSLLADLKTYPLPKDLPIQVLIGLKVKEPPKIQEGDGLISYAGQRLAPELTVDKMAPLLKADTRYGGQVTEQLLGFGGDKHPGDDSALSTDSFDYWGYCHTDAPVGTLAGATPMVQVDCETVAGCRHATFQAIRTWLQHHTSSAATLTERTLTLTFDVADAHTNQAIPFAWVRVYRSRSTAARVLSDTDTLVAMGQTDKHGTAQITVEFAPEATYYANVNAWGYLPITQIDPVKIPSTDSMNPIHLGSVRLAAKPDRSRVSGVITANNHPLGTVSYYVRSGDMEWVGQSDAHGYYAITGLLPGMTSIWFMKEGYLVKQVYLNNQPNQAGIYNVVLAPDKSSTVAVKSPVVTDDHLHKTTLQTPTTRGAADDFLDFSQHTPQLLHLNVPASVTVKNHLDTLF